MRDVLVALCGLTPQVVTETLWALARRDPRVHPAEVWILTTEAGRKRCLATLLGPGGALARYVREYRPRPVARCGPGNVIVLRAADGAPLDDVRSEQDHRAIADRMAEFLGRQTARSGVRLHCSVAGGRKTMGVLLAAALQLFGRADDRLYHVLVHPSEFENHPEFFYKPKRPRRLTAGNGAILNTSEAIIELAEIPYVRLRDVLSEPLRTEKLSFTEVVASAQAEVRALSKPDPVRIEVKKRRLVIGHRTVCLSPAGLHLYAAFARIKNPHCVEPHRRTCEDCCACYPVLSPQTWEAEVARIKALTSVNVPGAEKSGGDALAIFRSALSKVNRAIKEALGSARLASRYEVRSVGERYEKRYGLAADKTLIEDT
jgi:CRISPR-associated protein (TIGR02584 family)